MPDRHISQADNDRYWMQYAIQLAKQAEYEDEVPVGAVLVCSDKIVARAHNLTETLNDVTAHAEMQAFTAATHFLGAKYLKECTLYVTLEPCVMCAGAAYWTQLGRLVFGAKDEKRGYSLVNQNLLHPSTTVTGNVLEEECSALLTLFFKRKRI